MSFNRYPGGADPISPLPLVSSFVEDFFQRTLVGSRGQEEVNRFVEGGAGFIGRLTAAHDIERHSVGDELIAFLPHLNGIFNVHGSHRIIVDSTLSLPGVHAAMNDTRKFLAQGARSGASTGTKRSAIRT